jgi:hypothetical protein
MMRDLPDKAARRSKVNSKSSHCTAALAALIRDLPDREPLFDLTPGVLDQLAPKNPPLHHRLWHLANAPRTVTIRPLRLVSALGVCLLIAAAIYLFPGRQAHNPHQPPGQHRVPLIIRFQSPEAGSVHLIGSFNDWQPAGYAMRPSGPNHQWTIRIQVPPGSYEYAFLVDNNQIVPDPEASFYKSDSFGSSNAILFVDAADENSL